MFIEKLRTNFNLTNLLTRIMFVCTFVFAMWQKCAASALYVTGSADPWITFAAAILSGILVMFLFSPVVNLLLNITKIYSVPRAEYSLIAMMFAVLNYFILGVLNLVNLFTPLLLAWGAVLFPLISSLVSVILFYRTTAKLYFNDLTAVYYFKAISIVYLIGFVLFAVIL